MWFGREGWRKKEGCSPLDKGRQCFLWLVRGWHRCFLRGGGALCSEKNARALTAGRYCCRSLGKIRARRSVLLSFLFLFLFRRDFFLLGGHLGFAVSVLIRGALRSGLSREGGSCCGRWCSTLTSVVVVDILRRCSGKLLTTVFFFFFFYRRVLLRKGLITLNLKQHQ